MPGIYTVNTRIRGYTLRRLNSFIDLNKRIKNNSIKEILIFNKSWPSQDVAGVKHEQLVIEKTMKNM